MNVLPPISARAENARPEYLEYLKSASWRVTRNRALMLADYRCERCNSKRDLQVHHRTYERLGHEWDQDLEVLCGGCHGDHHTIQSAKRGDPVRLFIVLAGDALNDRQVSTYSDLAEAVKTRGALLGLPYDSATVGAAVDIVLGQRPFMAAPIATSAAEVRPDPGPVNKGDALRIMVKLREDLDLPSITLKMIVTETAETRRAHEDKVRAQAAQMQRTAPRRRSVREQLEEIFQ
jgi:hypothetical protein